MAKNPLIWMVAVLACAGLVAAAVFAPVRPRRAASELIVDAPADPPAGMAWIPGGSFRMGADPVSDPTNPDRIKLDEVPAHEVELDGYWMDEAEVTNRQFDEFARMTGYVTFAEKEPTPEELARSGIAIELLKDKKVKPGSMCFNPGFNRKALKLQEEKAPLWEYQVWQYVDGANWRHPDGPGSSIDDRLDHPVVHVSWEDAVAYCEWAGKELPTEAQWEYAARGGRKDALYPWGDDREPQGQYQCNYWQGAFPAERLKLDGFEGSSPAKSFPPNGYGLYDMSGNVWEWCADYFDENYYAHSPKRNPPGPKQSFDSREPSIIKRVTRGGSFLCNTNSCTGYRCSARMAAEFNSGTFHTGFRGVVNPAHRAAYESAQAKIADWRKSYPTP